MNQIFRVIYSKTKHTFVVASELAKGHSRSQAGETPSAAALLAALLLTCGALLAGSGPSWAAGTTNTHGIQFGSATVTGGESNVAGGYHDAYEEDDDDGIVEKKGVTGDSVSGGYYNQAYGGWSSISGGEFNITEGNYSSVTGGAGNTARGIDSSVGGGGMNTAEGESSSVSGGWFNNATGMAAAISGGSYNRASGTYASATGGEGNTASGANASITGGAMNEASGRQSYVGGGEYNRAVGPQSTVAGGKNNLVTGYEEERTAVDKNGESYTYKVDIGVGSSAFGGRNSVVQGNFSTAIAGGSTGSGVNDALAAGSQSVVTVSNGTAIGYQSTADKAGTISFGHNAGDVSGYKVTWKQKASEKNGKYYDADNKEITVDQYYDLVNQDSTWNDYTKAPTITAKKYNSASYNRLVKVADGVDDHDVVVMEQLKSYAQTDASNIGANLKKSDGTAADAAAITANENAWGAAIGTGKVENGNGQLVTGDTVYHALSTISVKADGKVEKGNAGIVNGGTVYNETRVAKDGHYIKAANTAGANITALDNQVAANAGNIFNLDHRVGELGSRINKVGAGAAALAALHPLDFDPSDKWDFAVGAGNYRNQTAAAVGLFYRPNARSMFNLGWTMGDNRNMVNGGFSIKLGRGSVYNDMSKAQMAETIATQSKEISAMKADNAAIRADYNALKADNEAKDKRIDALEKQMQEILARLGK